MRLEVEVLMDLGTEVLLQELLLLHGPHSTLSNRDIAVQQIFCEKTTFVFTSMRYLAHAIVLYQYGSGGTAPEIEGGEWSALKIGRLTPGEKAPSTPQLDAGWTPGSLWTFS
jgi:hypothetical protein